MTYPWGDTRRFNSYAGYFRRLFGCRVQKLSVDAGFTCPNRDGTIGEGGCTFCNNGAFTPSYCMPSKSVGQQIAEGIEFHRNRYRSAQRYLVYFQAFSNTYAPLERLKRLYDEALAHPGVAGIVVGTRPDCVDERKLDYFAGLARDRYVALEYGIESTFDATLRAVNRGHDFACARRAVEMTAARGLHVGAHFILGLPGETDAMLLDQVERINALPLTTPHRSVSASGSRRSTSTCLSKSSAGCVPAWSSNVSPRRLRRATLTAATGASCATSSCSRCSKKDWRNAMYTKAKFLLPLPQTNFGRGRLRLGRTRVDPALRPACAAFAEANPE